MEEKEVKVGFFFVVLIISVIISYKIVYRRNEDSFSLFIGIILGIIMGVGFSFLAGSFFIKKDIIVEKYFISPMFFDGKPIVALMERHDNVSDYYVFQTKEGDETKSMKHCLLKENIFFTLGENEERYLEVRRSKVCKRNIWIWFFYETGIIKSKAVFRKGDNFLTLCYVKKYL